MSNSLTPWAAACQASLSFTISWSLLKLMSMESVMPSNYLILCHPLLFPPSIFTGIRVFSNELALHIRWPKYWSFSISPSNEYSGLISLGLTDDEAEALILWPPDVKSQLIGKDPDSGKDWGQEEKGATKNEMVGLYHWLNGRNLSKLQEIDRKSVV